MEPKYLEPKNWLRCNNCFSLMRHSKVPFSLSFCSHIFCSKCVQRVAKNCPQCHTQNIRMMPLVEPLNPEVKHCFESTETLLEKLTQATLFQNLQLSINCNRLYEFEKKYAYAKAEYQRKSDDNKILQKRIRELEAEIESSHKKMSRIQNSSAMMTPNSTISSLPRNAHTISSFSHSSGEDHPFAKKKSFQTSRLPSNLQGMDLSAEFRIPSMTKVPRSAGSSSRTSSNSSKGTPFSNFTAFSHRR